MKKFRRVIIIIVVVSVLSIITYLFINLSKKRGGQKTAPEQAVESKADNGSTLTLRGIIWTSGLTDQEKRSFDTKADYQLEKTPYSKDWPEEIYGMFLESGSYNYSEYLGKCVEITGNIRKGWENLIKDNYEINGKWTYSRSDLDVNKITVLYIKECIGDFDYTAKNRNPEDKPESKTASGILNFAKRPAPDIGYDLELLLDKPFTDELNSSGDTTLTERLDITPSTDELYVQILENIGKKVIVSGSMVWGYSESRYMVADELQIQ